MPLISLLIVLAVIGLCLYLVENYIPMSAPIKTVIRVIVVIVLVIWLLQLFGITGPSVPSLNSYLSQHIAALV